jgi:hypothetical protein
MELIAGAVKYCDPSKDNPEYSNSVVTVVNVPVAVSV